MFRKLLKRAAVLFVLIAFFVVPMGVLYSSDSDWRDDEKCIPESGGINFDYDPKSCPEHAESECEGANITITRTSTRECKGDYPGWQCNPEKKVDGSVIHRKCFWNSTKNRCGMKTGSITMEGTLIICESRQAP